MKKKKEVVKISKLNTIRSNNSVIKKANTLISSKCRLNINEQKILYKVISQIHINDKDFKDYAVKTADLIRFIGTNSQTIYKDLKQYTHNLLKEVLTIEDDNRTIQTNWFSVVEHVNTQKILFSFHPKLKPYLLDLKKNFTRFGIENIRNFKSKYSPKIYELLKQYENLGYRRIYIDELKKILGVEGLYKNYNDFKKKIIMISQEEINRNSDIIFEFREIKEGRKVVEIAFYIKSKKIDTSNVIDLLMENKQAKVENKPVCFVDLSNDTINTLKEKIRKIIDDEVKEKKLLEWIESGKEVDIDFYLDNWTTWDYKTKATKAGFFIDLVDNNRPIPSGKKGMRTHLDKPVQATNYEQRDFSKYTDEDWMSFYDNIDFIKNNDDKE